MSQGLGDSLRRSVRVDTEELEQMFCNNTNSGKSMFNFLKLASSSAIDAINVGK